MSRLRNEGGKDAGLSEKRKETSKGYAQNESGCSDFISCLIARVWRVPDAAANRKDGKGPEISMDNSEISVSIHADEAELLSGVTAYDAKDGDVTDSLAVEHISNLSKRAAENQHRCL